MAAGKPDWLGELDSKTTYEWVRCALQVNPYGYACRHGKSPAGDEAKYNDDLVAALKAAGVGLVAVTDHYRINESETLLQACRKAGIVALPGFEASTVEGVHFLVIFDESSSVSDVERVIGQCKITDLGSGSPHGGISAVELLRLCADEQLACIAAHATHDNGLLKHLAGQPRIAVWRSEDLHGICIPGAAADVPNDTQRRILRNSDRKYERPRPPAILNAKDIGSVKELEQEGATCQLRMSSRSLEALRHAMLDPQSRVLLDSDPPRVPRPSIVAVHWEGGLLDGQTLPLCPSLNVLVGAPGVGKSTVIESLRCAFELVPRSERAREDYEAIRDLVLRNGTTISVVVDHPTPSPRRYVIERTLPDPPLVRIADTWDPSEFVVADLTPAPDIYGQHEIADLAESSARRTQLLERFTSSNADRAAELKTLDDQLAASLELVTKRSGEVEHLVDQLSLLPGARERLQRFDELKVAERLAEQVTLDREENVIKAAEEYLAELEPAVADFADNWGDVPEILDDELVGDSPVLAMLRDVDAQTQSVSTALQQAVRDIDQAIADASTKTATVRKKWKARRATADAQLQAIKEELEAENIDHEVFRQARNEVDTLQALEPQLVKARRLLDSAVRDRNKTLARRVDLQNASLKSLRKAANQVTTRLSPHLKLEVSTEIDMHEVDTLVRSSGGRLKETLKIFQDDESFSPRDLANAARDGEDAITKRWPAIPPQQARHLTTLGLDALMKLEALSPLVQTTIYLNTAAEGSPPIWTAIERLSKGQRAIAVLLLLLLDSDAPLIVDQPEDDLDNSYIATQIVGQVRSTRNNRQFVFSTHNANLPILTDADVIAGLSIKDGSDPLRAEIRPQHLGPVDARGVRELIEQRLEGGRPAFEARRQRYRLVR